LSLADSDNGICQNPALKSRLVIQVVPCRVAITSSMIGMGYVMFFVIELSLRKSQQNRLLPSFFVTKTTGEAHSAFDLVIKPAFSIFSMDSSMRVLFLRGVL